MSFSSVFIMHISAPKAKNFTYFMPLCVQIWSVPRVSEHYEIKLTPFVKICQSFIFGCHLFLEVIYIFCEKLLNLDYRKELAITLPPRRNKRCCINSLSMVILIVELTMNCSAFGL